MDVNDRATHHFPEEILVDILTRLHVRSLLRFKCVSKSWRTLISDPYFTMKHLSYAKNDRDSQKLLIKQMCPKDGIFSMYSCPLSPVQPVKNVQKLKLKLDYPSNPEARNCSVLCCYDGLVVIMVPDILDKDSTKLLLWNPSIRESILLPAPEFSSSQSRFSLGYDSTNGEYKILHVHKDFGQCKFPNEILALKGGGSWKRIDEHPHAICRLVFSRHLLPFVHAAFHWVTLSNDYFMVVSFGISNEVYGEIPLPEGLLSKRVGSSAIGVCVLEGMLCVYYNSLEMLNTFEVWVMKEYGVKGSWMQLLTVKDDPWIWNACPKYRFADGEVLFWCMSIEHPSNSFRTRNGPFRSWPRYDIIQNGYSLTESLISPKSLTY